MQTIYKPLELEVTLPGLDKKVPARAHFESDIVFDGSRPMPGITSITFPSTLHSMTFEDQETGDEMTLFDVGHIISYALNEGQVLAHDGDDGLSFKVTQGNPAEPVVIPQSVYQLSRPEHFEGNTADTALEDAVIVANKNLAEQVAQRIPGMGIMPVEINAETQPEFTRRICHSLESAVASAALLKQYQTYELPSTSPVKDIVERVAFDLSSLGSQEQRQSISAMTREKDLQGALISLARSSELNPSPYTHPSPAQGERPWLRSDMEVKEQPMSLSLDGEESDGVALLCRNRNDIDTVFKPYGFEVTSDKEESKVLPAAVFDAHKKQLQDRMNKTVKNDGMEQESNRPKRI